MYTIKKCKDNGFIIERRQGFYKDSKSITNGRDEDVGTRFSGSREWT